LNSTVERLEGNRVRITIEHTADEVRDAIDEAYSRISRKLRLPGFRPGKAPRPIIDTHVGRESVLAEALEDLVERSYPRALDALDLRPMERPDTGDLDGLAEGEGHTFTAEVDVRPELMLSSIEGLKAVVPPSKTSDAEVDAQIDYLRERYATLAPVEDRGVADGDFALLSFTGTVDGKPADDLTVDKYLYEVGRGIMPHEFDEGLIGTVTGGTKHVEFAVPETAANTEYVGKPAAFDIEVHEIKAKALAVADDEFAGNVGGFETIAELRDDVRAKLDENKATAHDRLVERGARESLAERLEGEVPEALITGRAESMTEEFFESMQEQGMSTEDYLAATGLTQDEIQSDISREAGLRVRDELALEALYRQAGLALDEGEVDREVEKYAASEKVPVERMRERLMEAGVLALIRERLMQRHATRWLVDHVEVVEETPASERAVTEAKPKKKATAKKPSKKDGSAKEDQS
jgi:trigger factor